MTDKVDSNSYIAAQEANQTLGNVRVLTGEHLLSTEEGAKILNKYELGMKDGLTGLLSSQPWHEEAKRFFDYCIRRNSTFSILYLDVNDFKAINDGESHSFGDEVLKLVSSAIKGSIRETDIAGRVGGDEFVVGLPDAGDKVAEEVKNRICLKLSQLTQEDEKMRRVKPSITFGLQSSTESKTFEDVLDKADKKMLELKKLNNYGR